MCKTLQTPGQNYRNFRVTFLTLKFRDFSKIFAWDSLYFSLNLNLVIISCNFLFFDLETKQYSSEAGRDFIRFYLCLARPAATQDNVKAF